VGRALTIKRALTIEHCLWQEPGAAGGCAAARGLPQQGVPCFRTSARCAVLPYLSKVCCASEPRSYLSLVDSCITQLKAHGPSRTCNESNEEEEKKVPPSHQPSEWDQTLFFEALDLH